MTSQYLSRLALVAAIFGTTACERKTATAAPAAAVDAAGQNETAGIQPDAGSQFNPLLRSDALKDAIHRAMTTGQNQRWQDGELSGYAVPSQEKLPNGCRTIRYTVDQRPEDPMMTINACAGS